MLWWTLKQLKSADSKKRERAAQKLGESNDVRALRPLWATLKDPDSSVQKAAQAALLKIIAVRLACPPRPGEEGDVLVVQSFLAEHGVELQALRKM
jgi:hypothetical protein